MDDDTRRRQFLKAMDPAIAEANRHAIHAKLPKLNKDDLLRFVVSVARARAHYLEQAMAFANREQGAELDSAEIRTLSELRTKYEEAVKAYDALSHAVERGYIELEVMS